MSSTRLLLLSLLITASTTTALAQADPPRVTISGTLAVGGGATLLDGDRPAFQRDLQHRKHGYGGIDSLRVLRETDISTFKFDLRLVPGDENYRAAARFEKTDAYYLDAGFEQFRVFYDGTAGFYRPTRTTFRLYDEDLSIDRNVLWIELGTLAENRAQWRLRYERRARDGRKDSTHWADTNLVGTAGTRNVVPTFWELDEVRDTATLDVSRSLKNYGWNLGARYEHQELDNSRHSRRRPTESADRIVTSKDETTSDLFAVHGYYERRLTPKVRFSTGGLVTKLDANLAGSRIYGQSYDPVYDPAYVRKQARDEGFFGLHGDAQLKQYVANFNVVFEPAKHWQIRTSLRFEDLAQDTLADFEETNVATNLTSIIEEVEGENRKRWDEFTEELEVRYTGRPNWTFSGRAEWVQGTGDVNEERLLVHTSTLTIDRETDYKRLSQKYSATANWYARPGLTLALQYYFKGKVNDYDARRDSTTNAVPSGDRYPAYITDQDFETNDFNARLSWRPTTSLNLVTRYDYQRSRVISVEAGLNKVESSQVESHIVSQNATWNPIPALYVNGSVNVTFDQLSTPAYSFVLNSDNNYVSGSLGAGYAVGKATDLYVDYSFYRADNFVDNSARSMPYGADARQEVATLTWVHRASDHIVYTVKYGFATNRDGLNAGLNDYDAQSVYAKVQYNF